MESPRRRRSTTGARLIELPKIPDRRGNLTFLEGGYHLQFKIERAYWIHVYDVVYGASRGGHAHRALQQLIVAVMSRFVVTVDDGCRRRAIELDRADRGLYIPPMIWRELKRFSSGAVCVVLASMPYDEADYIRDRDEFASLRGRSPTGLRR